MAQERLKRHVIYKSEGYRRFNLSQIQTQRELWGEIVCSCCDRLLVLAALMRTEYPSKLVSKPFQTLTFLAHSLALWPLPVYIRAAAERPGKTEE